MLFQESLILCTIPAVISIIVKDPPPTPNDYKYSYSIEDPTTGDSKSQHEVRHGDLITGAYSVVDPDGRKRIVEYTADSKNGFKAIVREEPSDTHQPLNPTPTLQLQNRNYVDRVNRFPVFGPRSSNNRVRVPFMSYYPKQQIYFTVRNEIKAEDIVFPHGQYFLPATK